MPDPHRFVVHQDEVPAEQRPAPFASQRRMLGRAAGGRQLGCSLLQLAPGAAAWPFHAHLGNEEALYILSGKGELRLGAARIEVRAGHYCALPAHPDLGHQLIARGDAPLRYLCFSTMHAPEIGIFPDSNKLIAIAGSAPGGDRQARFVTEVFRRDDAVDYFDGERPPSVSGAS